MEKQIKIQAAICIVFWIFSVFLAVGAVKNAYARDIDTIIIHHTGVDLDQSVMDITKYHESKKWDGIGYHWFIDIRGKLFSGRDEDRAGAHAKERNANSIGICVVGKGPANIKQLNTLIEICSEVMDRYDIENIEAHHENCPGETVDVSQLKRAISIYESFNE